MDLPGAATGGGGGAAQRIAARRGRRGGRGGTGRGGRGGARGGWAGPTEERMGWRLRLVDLGVVKVLLAAGAALVFPATPVGSGGRENCKHLFLSCF